MRAAAERLEKNGNAPLTVVCEAGATPCDCAIADAFTVETPEHPTCTEATSPIPGWHVYHVEGGWAQYDYLFDDATRFIAIVGDDNDRGRHTETTKLDKAEIKTTGGHRVVWLYTSSQEDEQSASTENDDQILDHHDDTQTLTLCVLGATNACPLAVPIDHEVTDAVYAGSPDPKPLHPALSSKTSVTVADDGTATVVATAGKPDDDLRPLLGPHKLW